MNTNINELPENVQAEIRTLLRSFTGCSVTRANGRYSVMAGTCIDNSRKPADFKVWDFKARDVLTKEEIAEGIAELNAAMMKLSPSALRSMES